MTTLSTIAKLPRPELSDPPNAPSAFTSLTNELDKIVIPRFASSTARDAAIPAPTSGQHAWLTDVNTLTVYSASSASWIPYAAGGSTAKALIHAETKGMTGGTQNLAASQADVGGCSLTVTTTKPTAIAEIAWAGDFSTTASGAGIGILVVHVDGVEQATQINFCGSNTVAGTRATCANEIVVPLGSPGSHTIKLRAHLSGVLGVRLNGPHTALTVKVFE